MAKVILISPPYVDMYGPIKSAAGRYFPLGIGYIAAVLRRAGHAVQLYEPEAQGMTFDSVRELFTREAPDIVGITSATPNFPQAVKLARIVKETRGCPVVLGGIHASALPEYILTQYADCFDFIVIGEGEQTMLELVDALSAGRPTSEIAGLWHAAGGAVHPTAPRKAIEELDALPHPARDLIPQELFAPNAHNARHRRCLTLLTSRGCPFTCSFCASHLTMGRRYRMHSAEYVLEEMQELKDRYGAQQLLITDDTFTINRDRLAAVCEGMIARKLQLDWFCFSQISAVNDEMLELMKRAGCYNIGFGVESASPRILKKMGKPVDLDRCRRVFDRARRLGLKTQAFFVLGTPGEDHETPEEIEQTIKFALELNPTLAFFNMYVPYPGTRDFNMLFQPADLDSMDWSEFVAIGTHSVLRGKSIPAEQLEDALHRAHRQFYGRPSQWLHMLSRIGTVHELWQYAKGGAGLLAQIGAWRRH